MKKFFILSERVSIFVAAIATAVCYVATLSDSEATAFSGAAVALLSAWNAYSYQDKSARKEVSK